MDVSQESDVLVQVLSQVLATGATAFEVEYKDGEERVFAFNGSVGIGIAAFGSETAEARQLRKQLWQLRRKRKKFRFDETDFFLKVEVYDSFGEIAFHGTIVRS